MVGRTPHLRACDYQKIKDSIGDKLSRFNFYAICKDGFCGLECCGKDSRIVTKSFLLEDEDLALNIAASIGGARFAVLDYEGKSYEGFCLEDSLLGNCDGVAVTPRWKDGRSLMELVGKRVWFCVELDSATLYFIRGVFRPFIKCPQTSVSNPLQITFDGEED